MPDSIRRRPPLDGFDLETGSPRVGLANPGPATRFLLRGGEAVAARAGPVLGLTIPQEACRAAVQADRAALWLGPDEWLLLAPEAEGRDIAERLLPALDGLPHALTDIGHGSAGLIVAGPAAAELLNAGCPLDLHESAFPVGMCTRTLLGKAEIVLWRTAPETFRLEAGRSFMAYVREFLLEAVRGLRAGS